MKLKPCLASGSLDSKKETMLKLNQIAKEWGDSSCFECEEKDKLLKEMAEALEEVVRCLSHGLQDCRASVTAKAMLQKYHEQNGELK